MAEIGCKIDPNGYRVRIDQQSWADTISAAITGTLRGIYGKCSQISVKINDNTGNRTLTLAIADELGGVLFSQSGIAENATTVYKATSDSTAFDAFIAGGNLTVTLTPSGDPGTSGMTVDILLGIER